MCKVKLTMFLVLNKHHKYIEKKEFSCACSPRDRVFQMPSFNASCFVVFAYNMGIPKKSHFGHCVILPYP